MRYVFYVNTKVFRKHNIGLEIPRIAESSPKKRELVETIERTNKVQQLLRSNMKLEWSEDSCISTKIYFLEYFY